jgi:hypothetical protein
MTQYPLFPKKSGYYSITHLNKYLLLFLSFILLSSILFSSCSQQKKIIRAPIKEEGADYLFEKLKQNELKFDWFTSKFSANYKNKGESNSFDGQIRIRRDSVIWLSFSPLLGIEVFRMIITVDSVKFINRINNTYFIGDYNYVNKFLNTNIDFDILQSFMIGNDLSFYENGKFRASLDGGQYKLSTADRMKLKKFVRNSQESLKILIQNIWIDPVSFKIARADVKEIRKQNLKLEANYSSFEKIEDQLFPKEVNFDIYADNNIHVTLEFNRININTPQLFPFKIPPSYRQIK